ncbi:MAG: SusC/RagA family TonB-linked outer membrane protein [Proteiniphilum sp.]|jgi:TonB-linked SusC/RagA family outer membrane protein|uniref:SusC/RagA family TonB-linked outer membrane protein n=1 Tax=Proteiniphilum sp. TaxID=1926877 RepID=UPI002B1F3C35|nr:SusC/RagA family TonB-linked outer membrane protein [Proteiniphilum sp.]MEA5127580.1 SusC/RagA family TonB-linked outer membrane protein [Proteiniphilum sp.]
MKKNNSTGNYLTEKVPIKHFLLIMRVTIILLFAGVFCAMAETGHAQNARVTMNKRNVTLKEVLNEIERQTDYLFIYNNEVNTNEKASVKAKHEVVSQVLHSLLKDKDIDYSVEGNHIILSAVDTAKGSAEKTETTPVQQQKKRITGTVTDGEGMSIIGANIVEAGTTNGTITDTDGKFSLDVENNASIRVSYIGYLEQNINTAGRSSLNITLQEDTKALEEVVVVGYGVQKKETLSGAVTAIKAEEIVTTKTENFISNIQGKVAGLQIRQQTGLPGMFDNLVSIRGYGTPLVIIDGVQRGRNDSEAISELAQLSSEDIESVSILKDASAAIYGMNSANGVLLITTKKGQDQGRARVSYTGRFGMEKPTGMQYNMDAYNYMLMANEMQRNDGRGTFAAYDFETLEKYRTNTPGYQDTDLIGLTLHDSMNSQEHTVTVRGGNTRTQYFASTNFTRQNGLLITDIMWYERYNFRANLTTELSKDLKLNIGFSGRQNTRNDSNEDFWAFMKGLQTSERTKGIHTMANPEHYTLFLPENKNMLAIIDPDVNGYRRWETLNGQTQAELTYTAPFLKGLTLSAMGDYNIRQNNETQLYKSYPLYDYFSDKQLATFNTDSYRNTITLYSMMYLRLMANYNKQFGSHGFNVMVGMEGSKSRYDQLMGRRLYSDLFTQPILDMATATTATNSGTRTYGRLAAYFGRLNYDFAGKYLVEMVLRYDGSYRYAPEKRWSFFPSASVAWRLSEEQFVKDLLPFIDNLKIRASYGKSGRDQGTEFQYIPGYTSGSDRGFIFNDGTLTTGMYPPGVVNNRMSWVTSEISNIGIDLGLPNGKFGVTYELFYRKNSGILVAPQTQVPNYFGATLPQENLNSDMNIGMELSLDHRGKIGTDFTYLVSGNVTFARQKRLHVERAPFTSQWNRWRTTYAPDRFIGGSLIHKYNGQYQSLEELETAPLHGGTLGNSKMLPGEFRLMDRNGDGVINTNDQYFENWGYGGQGYVSGGGGSGNNSTGPINPPLQYGLTLAGTYKNFSLNLLFQGASLYSVNFAQDDVWGYGRYPALHERYYDRWHTVNNDDDPYDPATKWISGKYAPLRPWVNPRPGVTSDYRISLFRPMGTYLRLKNIELGYTIPRSTLKKLNISNVRLFVNATNLFTFKSKELGGMDPEQQEKDYDANLTYPIIKGLNFGLNLTF